MEVLEGKRSAKEQEGVNLATPSIEQMFKDMFKDGDVSMCPFLNMQKKKKKKEEEGQQKKKEITVKEHVLENAGEYPLLAARMNEVKEEV